MVKGTPTKKPSVKPANSLLDFFHRADHPARPRGSGQDDVKPDVRAMSKPEEKVKSERRGSEHDPVVISDDEMTTGSSTLAKRRKVVRSPLVARQSSAAQASPLAIDHETFVRDLSDSHAYPPVAGPSRSPSIGDPSRSPSVPTVSAQYPVPSPSRSPGRSTWLSQLPPLQHPFPGRPEYVCPPTWPQIVNTAAQPDDYDDLEADGCSDSYSNKGRGQVPKGEHNPSADVDSDLDLEAEDLIEEVPVAEPPVEPSGIGDPASEWDEGDDEGMGMEEDEEGGEDETAAIVEIQTPKRPMKAVGKVDECPMCGKSLKGQVKSV